MKLWATILVALLLTFLGVADVQGTPNHDRVTICHATASVQNPYVQITVDPDAADGDIGNDHGQGDHSTHEGDIIPPHDTFAGLNWTGEGRAIHGNGCNDVEPTARPTATDRYAQPDSGRYGHADSDSDGRSYGYAGGNANGHARTARHADS